MLLAHSDEYRYVDVHTLNRTTTATTNKKTNYTKCVIFIVFMCKLDMLAIFLWCIEFEYKLKCVEWIPINYSGWFRSLFLFVFLLIKWFGYLHVWCSRVGYFHIKSNCVGKKKTNLYISRIRTHLFLLFHISHELFYIYFNAIAFHYIYCISILAAFIFFHCFHSVFCFFLFSHAKCFWLSLAFRVFQVK